MHIKFIIYEYKTFVIKICFCSRFLHDLKVECCSKANEINEMFSKVKFTMNYVNN